MTDKEAYLLAIASSPSAYAKGRLKMNLHPTQVVVLDAIFEKKHSKVSFRCGNETGKTSFVGAASILYVLEMKNAMCVSTSATFRQITKQLIPALKQYANLYPKWEFLDNAIKINGKQDTLDSQPRRMPVFRDSTKNLKFPSIFSWMSPQVSEMIYSSRLVVVMQTWLFVCGFAAGTGGCFLQY